MAPLTSYRGFPDREVPINIMKGKIRVYIGKGSYLKAFLKALGNPILFKKARVKASMKKGGLKKETGGHYRHSSSLRHQ